MHVHTGMSVSDDAPVARPRRRRNVLLGCAIVVAIPVVIILGVVGYFAVQEWRSPSGQVVVSTGQDDVTLQMPTELVTPAGGSAVDLSQEVPQPPSRVEIPRVGIAADVYPMTSDPPNFPAAGWQLGTAMPGTEGNVVVYGAQSGPAAVFQELRSVTAGDEILLVAGTTAYVYHASEVSEVDAGQTDILLPTGEPTVTLITDAGEWDEATGGFSRRLIVRGQYVEARTWSNP